jgi:hypothetical protein
MFACPSTDLQVDGSDVPINGLGMVLLVSRLLGEHKLEGAWGEDLRKGATCSGTFYWEVCNMLALIVQKAHTSLCFGIIVVDTGS